VIRKLEEGKPINDASTYCHGVARLVFLQSLVAPHQYEKLVQCRLTLLSTLNQF